MSENLLNEFKELEQQNEKNNTEKVRLEERIKTLQEEREVLLQELTKLGIKEQELENHINTLTTEIKDELEKCKAKLTN
jgi:Holliday junction resolvasome RuvABC DNA-binding subunit